MHVSTYFDVFSNLILQWLQKYVIAKAGETRGSRTALLNKPICLNSDHDCSGRSTQVQNGDYWLQEIDNPHNSVNRLNWFCLAYDYTHQIWIWYYFVFSSNEISKTLNAYISKQVLWHLSTSSTTVFNYTLEITSFVNMWNLGAISWKFDILSITVWLKF